MEGATDRLEGAASILLCGSSVGRDVDSVCEGLLSDGASDGRTVLWVSFGRSPADCLSMLPDESVERAVIAVGTPPTGAAITDDSVTVDAVSTRSDLTALGIKLSRFLSSTDGEITICFDSLTSLLQHVDLDAAYEFLHTVTRQCYAEGGQIHFHLDTATVDDQTVAAITSLCDANVAYGRTPAIRLRTSAYE